MPLEHQGRVAETIICGAASRLQLPPPLSLFLALTLRCCALLCFVLLSWRVQGIAVLPSLVCLSARLLRSQDAPALGSTEAFLASVAGAEEQRTRVVQPCSAGTDSGSVRLATRRRIINHTIKRNNIEREAFAVVSSHSTATFMRLYGSEIRVTSPVAVFGKPAVVDVDLPAANNAMFRRAVAVYVLHSSTSLGVQRSFDQVSGTLTSVRHRSYLRSFIGSKSLDICLGSAIR